MSVVDDVKALILKSAEKNFTVENVPAGRFAEVRWPSLIPMIRYEDSSYRLKGFGSLGMMNGKIFGGIRSLTCFLTPFEGASVPVVLIDVMEVREKSTVFIEYFDKTAEGADGSAFAALKEKYADAEDYPDSPIWYNEQRMDCSLIKIAPEKETQRLIEMVKDVLAAYMTAAKGSEKKEENKAGIAAFSEEMAEKGTSAMEVLKKRFKEDGAKEFYRTLLVPQK